MVVVVVPVTICVAICDAVSDGDDDDHAARLMMERMSPMLVVTIVLQLMVAFIIKCTAGWEGCSWRPCG